MTKREFEKYNKVVKDKYGNRLYPGDTVLLCDSYYRDVNIGVVRHFAEKTVVIDAHYQETYKYWYKVQRFPHALIKVIDVNGDTSFMQNWPKKGSESLNK